MTKTTKDYIQDFSYLRSDGESVIQFRCINRVGDYHTAHDHWEWDGIEGESYIFLTKEVESLTDQDLALLIKSHLNIMDIGSFTIKRGDVFTFFNFNFS
jgi:hypothetical protein